MNAIKLEPSWLEQLRDEFEKPYMVHLSDFLRQEKESGQRIYPAGGEIFNAFTYTPFEKVSVVLLGQDPYHGAGQAHGLCFSVRKGVPVPPSLKNIFKELHADVGFQIPPHGELTEWAQRGVFLLNATLTVRAGQAGSHQKVGWETFTDAVIQTISSVKQGVVFLLWGKFAQMKKTLIDESRHTILEAAHPSPFSADNGFFGCRHFSKTNDALLKAGKKPIDWQITG